MARSSQIWSVSKGVTNMSDIIVEVRKGMVTGLYCDINDARFVVIDWDLLERDESGGNVGLEEPHASLTSLPPSTRAEYRRTISVA